MTSLFINSALVLCLMLIFTDAQAETHFVNGISNGFSNYATISRNGVEYRTDEMGPVFNQHLWNELSSADRHSLLNVYGWSIARRIDHFGSVGNNDMASWINVEQGWTAAAEALKQRHANKAFPTLTPVFGPEATLELPDFSCINPEIMNSADYKEALRLSKEISTDLFAGKEIYTLLTNANWDQVSIAVKTLSEPLIKVLVDTFVTGYITHGAKGAFSELRAQAISFSKDLNDFISGASKSSKTPPTPIELIERLDTYIGEMELSAENGVVIIQRNHDRLRILAENLKEADAAMTQQKRDTATAVRSALFVRTSSLPGPASLPAFLPADPKASAAEQHQSIVDQAQAFFSTNLMSTKSSIQESKSAAIDILVNSYTPHLNSTPQSYQAASYLADASDRFVRPYYEIMDRLSDVSVWQTTELPAVIDTCQQHGNALTNASQNINSVIDEQMTAIDSLHAKARWLDGYYPDYLGFRASEQLNLSVLKDFDTLIDMAATPAKSIEDVIKEYQAQKDDATEVLESLGTGVSKRQSWMLDYMSQYDSIRFNFENSLSYVIAAIKQLDLLHADTAFFKTIGLPTNYGGTPVYRYAVDVEGINARIDAMTDIDGQQTARNGAVKRLLEMRAEEEGLLHRLEVAQNAHLNSAQELDNFFAEVASHSYVKDYFSIIEEFSTVTGKTIKRQYDLYNSLIPDYSYYYQGSSALNANWLRNRSNLATNIQASLGLVSAKIDEYYQALEIYDSMETNKSSFLAMGPEDFAVFTSQVSTALDNLFLQSSAKNIWGSNFPSWQLSGQLYDRMDRLKNEYHNWPQPVQTSWSVRGRVVTPNGTAVPGIGVMLKGYLTANTITARDGSFLFDFISNGDFTLSIISNGGYQFPSTSAAITVSHADVVHTFTATPSVQSGYSVSGALSRDGSAVLGGVTVILTSQAGVDTKVISGSDGGFSFFGVPAGTYTIRPVAAATDFTPPTRTVTIGGSVGGVDFVAAVSTSKAYPLSVVMAGNGRGSITSQPSGISCPGTCSAEFSPGTLVTLQAVPESGSLFGGMYGQCADGDSCTVVMDMGREVRASFIAAPVITSFSLEGVSNSAVARLTFRATDSLPITGYLVSTSATPPSVGDPGWSALPPTSYVFGATGLQTLYGWVRDIAGNISPASSAKLTLNSIATPLSVTSFNIPERSTSVTVPILSLAASFGTGVPLFCVTESSSGFGCKWGAAPAQMTFSAIAEGIPTKKTLYAFAKDSTGTVSVAAVSSVVISLPESNPWLNITLLGSGTGSVNGTLSCTGGTCGRAFSPGALISLYATPDWNATFGGWSGVCSGTADCSLYLTSSQNIGVSFAPILRARAGAVDFSTLTAAYRDLADGGVIKSRVHVFLEKLTLDQQKTVVLDGGKDQNYEQTVGFTTIQGTGEFTVMIQRGTLVARGLVLR